jgi:hypothetical protein
VNLKKGRRALAAMGVASSHGGHSHGRSATSLNLAWRPHVRATANSCGLVTGGNHCARTAFRLHRPPKLRRPILRKFLSAVAFASLIGITTPALADSGSGGSIQRAIETARTFGVIGFNEIQFFDGKWEIEGRDPRGKTVRIDVDALTGAVLKLDRY